MKYIINTQRVTQLVSIESKQMISSTENKIIIKHCLFTGAVNFNLLVPRKIAMVQMSNTRVSLVSDVI